MLITNFSAGELSQTLFGRTDIPQYYSGASLLENFDVIPTGGIKRRNGTEFLRQLNESDGRIIPFIVNRELSFLLYLTPNKITIIKKIENENNRTIEISSTYESSANLQLYKNLSEITEVQHAQNFDTMILCHENYPPLEVKLIENTILIMKLEIDFNITIIAGKNITSQEIANNEESDVKYSEKGILKTEGNYPSTVSFFHERIIFACTKNNKQSIFASSIKQPGKNYNFSTYKIFLTEKREYSTLFGKINLNDTSIVETESEYIINSFIKPPEEYYVDSQLYNPSTKIEYINFNTVKFSEGLRTPGLIIDIENIRQLLQNKIDLSISLDNNPSKINIYNRHWRVIAYSHNPPNSIQYRREKKTFIDCYIKANSIKLTLTGEEYSQNNIGFGSTVNWSGWRNLEPISRDMDLPYNAADLLFNNNTHFNDKLLNFFNNLIKTDRNSFKPPHHESASISPFDIINEYENEKLNCIDSLYTNIMNTMRFELDTPYGIEYFNNFPIENLADVLARIVNTDKTYIAIYTKEILKDSYPTPDCGFTFEIASDMNDAIQWLAVNKGLIIGTETSEWIIPPGVHATNVYASMNSRHGSDKLQGTAVGDATCFFQSGKKALVEYHIPQQDTLFRANNMAMLSENMLRESPAKEFDYLSSPYTKLFITRENGTAITLLYERSTGTFAWGRFTTNGEIISAAVIPGFDGYDELFLIVKRGSNFFLEVLREADETYLDCHKKYEDDRTGFSDDAVIHDGFIGYNYSSRMRSMPVLANNKMKPNNIKNIIFRFLDSFMPKIKSLPNDVINTISKEEPYTGVHKILFPGSWDTDVMFELIHDKPTNCKILAISAEVN